MRNSTISLVVTLLTFGCTSPTVPSVDQGSPFTVGIEKSVYVPSLKLSLTFADVINDGRCPLNVYCLSAGAARIELSLLPMGSQSIRIFPYILGGVTKENNVGQRSIDTLGLRITLMQLDPYPRTDTSFSRSDYVATIKVTKH